jgi:hypothetical protein
VLLTVALTKCEEDFNVPVFCQRFTMEGYRTDNSNTALSNIYTTHFHSQRLPYKNFFIMSVGLWIFLSVVAFIAFIFLSLVIYGIINRWMARKCPDGVRLDGKTVIVTGASAGEPHFPAWPT